VVCAVWVRGIDFGPQASVWNETSPLPGRCGLSTLCGLVHYRAGFGRDGPQRAQSHDKMSERVRFSMNERQRNRLIQGIEELAPQALLGSLSETYRRCGNRTCRCHTGGPKHGPHLYVSYRGPAGKTTGYYVPEVAHAAVAKVLRRGAGYLRAYENWVSPTKSF
jgi:hypothetical protein